GGGAGGQRVRGGGSVWHPRPRLPSRSCPCFHGVVPISCWHPGCTVVRVPPGSKRATSSRSEEVQSEMAKVMVVDDAYADLKLMESILAGAGHQVLSYADAAQLEERPGAAPPPVGPPGPAIPSPDRHRLL